MDDVVRTERECESLYKLHKSLGVIFIYSMIGDANHEFPRSTRIANDLSHRIAVTVFRIHTVAIQSTFLAPLQRQLINYLCVY